MEVLRRHLPWIAWGICLLVAAGLGLKQLREPDLWWIIRTGEWIVQHGQVPTTDVFSFTHEGAPWINVKWGFEVLAYLVARVAGPESIFLLQVLANVLLVFLLAHLAWQLREGSGGKADRTPTAGLVLITLLTLAACNFRFIGRPEMVSHVLSLMVIGLFLRERQRPGAGIWWLVPVMVLWANLHEAYGVGMVLIACGTVGLLLDRRLAAGEKHPLQKQALLASLAALLAVAVNPRGPRMWLHPFNIFGQLGENKYTNELLDWRSAHFWRQEETWVVLLFAALALGALVFLPARANKRDSCWRAVLRTFGTGYPAVLLLFGGLAFTAHRNIPFFLLASAPLVVVAVDRLLAEPLGSDRQSMSAFLALTVLGLAFHATVVTNTFYRGFSPRDTYGLLVDPWKNPAGAVDFLRNKELPGPVFSDPLVSNHLLWALRPDFRSYIDLRDLDVFPTSFFDAFFAMTMAPTRFDAEDAQRGFGTVVLYRQQFQPLHAHLANHPEWNLVFADPVAVVFTKAANVGPRDLFQAPPPARPSALATSLGKLLWPGYRARGSEADVDVLAASHYLVFGWNELALQRADRVALNDAVTGHDLRGQAFLSMASRGAGEASMIRSLDQAEGAFRQLLRADPHALAGHIGLCRTSMYRGAIAAALGHAQHALKVDGSNKDALLLAAECHSRLSQSGAAGAQRHVEQWLTLIERAHAVDPDDTLIRIRLGVFLCQRGQCDRVRELLRGVRGHHALGEADVKALAACRAQCRVGDR